MRGNINVTAGTWVTILGGTVLWLIDLVLARGGACEAVDESTMAGFVKGMTKVALFCFG